MGAPPSASAPTAIAMRVLPTPSAASAPGTQPGTPGAGGGESVGPGTEDILRDRPAREQGTAVPGIGDTGRANVCAEDDDPRTHPGRNRHEHHIQRAGHPRRPG